jgi:catechol 2,3-dioxygenase-like lactoylglutathione lyase family enzyme
MAITARKITPLLEVYDMRRSVAFYCDILGFEIQQKWEPDGHLHWAMLIPSFISIVRMWTTLMHNLPPNLGRKLKCPGSDTME